jgi:hypothetical protein
MDSRDDGAHGRCIHTVLPKIAPVAALAADTLKAEAEVCEEEAAVLTLDARAKTLFARLANLQARAVELGVHQPEASGRRSKPGPSASSRPLSPDAFIDQRSGLVERRMYLRLAREKAFPSKKVGKRVIARWGDVQAALAPSTDSLPKVGPEEGDLELDEIRVRLGLAVRGAR